MIATHNPAVSEHSPPIIRPRHHQINRPPLAKEMRNANLRARRRRGIHQHPGLLALTRLLTTTTATGRVHVRGALRWPTRSRLHVLTDDVRLTNPGALRVGHDD